MLRQLRAGKVSLMRRPRAAASTFTIGKKGKSTLREIYNGTAITEAAEDPPKPPWQANPSALAELEATADCPVWMSGRDAKVFFDQLLAPAELQPFLGRPVITIGELLVGDHGLSADYRRGVILGDERLASSGLSGNNVVLDGRA